GADNHAQLAPANGEGQVVEGLEAAVTDRYLLNLKNVFSRIGAGEPHNYLSQPQVADSCFRFRSLLRRAGTFLKVPTIPAGLKTVTPMKRRPSAIGQAFLYSLLMWVLA